MGMFIKPIFYFAVRKFFLYTGSHNKYLWALIENTGQI